MAVLPDIDTHLGRVLRRRRRALGLSQTALGSAIGVRFQQVQKYESGVNRMSAARLYELSRALDFPVAEFFVGLGDIDQCSSM